MPITTGELLQLPGLAGARLLGGQDGLKRRVQWVNIQEVLDCLDVLKEGELLITTGYGLATDLQLQQSLIQKLAQRGLSGLAIQTGFYLSEVPAQLIADADRLQFPLLELPRDASFRTLTEEVLREIVDKQNQLLTYAENIQTILTEAAMQKQDLGQLAQVLAEHIARTVRILSPDFKLFAKGTIVSQEHALVLFTTPHLIQEFAKLKAHNLLWEPQTELQNGISARHIKEMDGIPNQVLLPILGAKELLGYLSVLESGNSPRPGLSAKDLTALTRAAVVCSFILLQEKSILESERSLREDFLTDLLAGSFSSETALLRRASLFGYQLDCPQQVLILAWQNSEVCIANRLAEVTDSFLQQQPCHYLFKVGKQEITVLLGSRHANTTDISRQLYQQLTKEIIPLYAGLSSPAQTPTQLQKSYREAKESIELASSLQWADHLAFFPDLGIYRLLIGLKHTEELVSFYRQTIENLVNYDQVHQTDLIKTLESFFQSGGNSTVAAQKLFIHRHTLTYRLTRISQITGLNPQDPDHALQLQIGLLTARIYAPSGGQLGLNNK